MFDFMEKLDDTQAVAGIAPLPGVVSALKHLAGVRARSRGRLLCGLVTGNVEGIARKKMRATGLFATGVFSPPAADQAHAHIIFFFFP